MSEASATVEQVARVLMITPRRVQQLTSDGVIPRGQRGRYQLVPAVQGYIKFLQDRTVGRENVTDPSVRLKTAQAELAEIELACERGKLIELQVVADVVRGEYATVRTRLGSLPGILAPRLDSARALEFQPVIAEVVDDILTELSADDRLQDDADSQRADDAEGGEGGDPQAGPETEPD